MSAFEELLQQKGLLEKEKPKIDFNKFLSAEQRIKIEEGKKLNKIYQEKSFLIDNYKEKPVKQLFWDIYLPILFYGIIFLILFLLFTLRKMIFKFFQYLKNKLKLLFKKTFQYRKEIKDILLLILLLLFIILIIKFISNSARIDYYYHSKV